MRGWRAGLILRAFGAGAAITAIGAWDAFAQQGFVIAGGGASSETMHAFQGVIYAPASGLSETGPVFRGWLKGVRFYYVTDLPQESDARVEALGAAVEGEAGWQFAAPGARLALFGGASWRKYHLSPDDPGSPLQGEHLGLSAALDGEAWLGASWGVLGNGKYVTTFEEYWAQARPFLAWGGVKTGLDAAVWGGPDYTYVRSGLFIQGFEVPLGGGRRAFLGAEAGASLGLHDESLSPFGGLTVGFLF